MKIEKGPEWTASLIRIIVGGVVTGLLLVSAGAKAASKQDGPGATIDPKDYKRFLVAMKKFEKETHLECHWTSRYDTCDLTYSRNLRNHLGGIDQRGDQMMDSACSIFEGLACAEKNFPDDHVLELELTATKFRNDRFGQLRSIDFTSHRTIGPDLPGIWVTGFEIAAQEDLENEPGKSEAFLTPKKWRKPLLGFLGPKETRGFCKRDVNYKFTQGNKAVEFTVRERMNCRKEIDQSPVENDLNSKRVESIFFNLF